MHKLLPVFVVLVAACVGLGLAIFATVTYPQMVLDASGGGESGGGESIESPAAALDQVASHSIPR
jgi:hypothetical protein